MPDKIKIGLGSDHGGAALKNKILEMLTKDFGEKYEFIDNGGEENVSADYPDMAFKVSEKVSNGEYKFAILFCGTGQGISMAANKVRGIRAACVTDPTVTRLVREHNDANVICIGGRISGIEIAYDIAKTFLNTPFQGGRHQRRVDKISEYEKK